MLNWIVNLYLAILGVQVVSGCMRHVTSSDCILIQRKSDERGPTDPRYVQQIKDISSTISLCTTSRQKLHAAKLFTVLRVRRSYKHVTFRQILTADCPNIALTKSPLIALTFRC